MVGDQWCCGIKIKCFFFELVAMAEWVARQDCRAGGWRFKSRHSTSAETCMWGRQLAAMLALYIGKGVAPEVNLRECILRTPPPSVNKAEPTLALKPRGDVTRSPKQGYQWIHKWTCVKQKFKKKKKKNFSVFALL